MSNVLIVDDDVFARMQALARPLVDDASSVIRRLLETASSEVASSTAPSPRFLVLTRGERLKVGTRLRATFRRQEVEATVTAAGIEFNGELYPSPSAAARAVKEQRGVRTTASHANGWWFWSYFDESQGCFKPLNLIRTHGTTPSALRVERRGPITFRSLATGASGTRDTSSLLGTERPEPPPWR